MKSNKKQNIYRVVMLVVITAFVTSILTIIGFTNYIKKDGNIRYIITSAETNDLQSEILKIRAVIDQYYLGDINEKELIDGAVKGYVEALGDKYTQYLTGKEWEKLQEETLGRYEGIGVYISSTVETNQIIVISPIEGSPAEEAGLQSGDIILKVDGTAYKGDEIDVASEKMKGEAGTKVTLEIQRNDETKTVEVERRTVKLKTVAAKVLENNIGYVQISSFDEGTADEFKENVERLQGEGIKSLIIDVRDNPGGIVSEALQIADYIVPKNKNLLVTVDKDGKEDITKSKKDNFIDMNIVLLINGNSASSSEILAGALKDNEEATLIGTKTYGKGVMQQLLQLADGGAMKITTDEFFTPNKNKIDKVGIEPNEEVKLTTDKDGNVIDSQLKRAIEILK